MFALCKFMNRHKFMLENICKNVSGWFFFLFRSVWFRSMREGVWIWICVFAKNISWKEILYTLIFTLKRIQSCKMFLKKSWRGLALALQKCLWLYWGIHIIIKDNSNCDIAWRKFFYKIWWINVLWQLQQNKHKLFSLTYIPILESEKTFKGNYGLCKFRSISFQQIVHTSSWISWDDVPFLYKLLLISIEIFKK